MKSFDNDISTVTLPPYLHIEVCADGDGYRVFYAYDERIIRTKEELEAFIQATAKAFSNQLAELCRKHSLTAIEGQNGSWKVMKTRANGREQEIENCIAEVSFFEEIEALDINLDLDWFFRDDEAQ
jgi:hypothetical protein